MRWSMVLFLFSVWRHEAVGGWGIVISWRGLRLHGVSHPWGRGTGGFSPHGWKIAGALVVGAYEHHYECRHGGTT